MVKLKFHNVDKAPPGRHTPVKITGSSPKQSTAVLKRQLNLFLVLVIIIIVGLGVAASTLIQEKVDRMKGKLDETSQNFTYCSDTLNQFHSQATENEGKLNTTITDIQKYDELYEEKAVAFRQAEQQLNSTLNTLKNTEKQLTQTINELKTVRADLTSSKNTVASLNAEIAELEQDVASLKKDVTFYKDELDECEENC